MTELPPLEDARYVRLIALFQSEPYWPSELTHQPNTLRSTAGTVISLVGFGMQQHYHYFDCYVNTPPGAPSTPIGFH